MKESKYLYLLEDSEKIINLYLNNKSALDIAKIYNVNNSAIYFVLDKNNINRRDFKHMSKYKLDDDFFNNIDTEFKAYWLGFLFADGYITNKNYIGLALNSNDENHLDKFKSCIKTYNCSANCFSNTDNKYSRLIFKSEKMAETLQKYGCTKNKSLSLKFPICISDDLIKHFIRGYFDGDGSFSYSHKNYDFKIVGANEFLKSLIDVLKLNKINIDYDNIYHDKRANDKTFYTSVGNKKTTADFLKYIYDDSNIYLDRKFIKYKNFLDFIK